MIDTSVSLIEYDTPTIVGVYFASGYTREWAFANIEKGYEFLRRLHLMQATTMTSIKHVTIRRANFSLN